MKSITSRLNMFLAKIAGRNVDIDTLTPPVAVNATEELLLEIADRMDDVSSVPKIEEGDTGKVLTAGEDGAEWDTPAGGLPSMSDASDGDILTVDYGTAIWAPPNAYAEYDVIISTPDYSSSLTSDYTIIKMDYDSVLSKVRAGAMVRGVLIHHYNYDAEITGDTNVEVINMTGVCINSSVNMLTFDLLICNSSSGLRGKRILISFTSSPLVITRVDNISFAKELS